MPRICWAEDGTKPYTYHRPFDLGQTRYIRPIGNRYDVQTTLPESQFKNSLVVYPLIDILSVRNSGVCFTTFLQLFLDLLQVISFTRLMKCEQYVYVMVSHDDVINKLTCFQTRKGGFWCNSAILDLWSRGHGFYFYQWDLLYPFYFLFFLSYFRLMCLVYIPRMRSFQTYLLGPLTFNLMKYL